MMSVQPAETNSLGNGTLHHTSPDLKSSLTDAADLIREIDTAFSDMNTHAATAANDAEEARKNARVAQEVIRLYTGTPVPAVLTTSNRITINSPSSASPRHRAAPPLPPSSQPQYLTPGMPTTVEMTGSTSIESEHSFLPPRTPHSGDRLGAAHAEDVLQISLELERSRQRLEHVTMAHEETKSALARAEQRNASLQRQLEDMQNAAETERQIHITTREKLQYELSCSQERLATAEEDARMSKDLAKGNAETRRQFEGWLTSALKEIDVLRKHALSHGGDFTTIHPTSSSSSHSPASKRRPPPPPPPRNRPVALMSSRERVVRFADDPVVLNAEELLPILSSHQPPRPSRSMVSVGRQLLQRSLASPADGGTGVVIQRTPERRRRLRNRIDSPVLTVPLSPLTSPGRHPTTEDLGVAVEAYETLRATAEILKESGNRLNMTGHWWSEANGERTPAHTSTVHLESLARHFCTSVEVTIDRKNKDIAELQALCSLWEERP